MLSLGKEAQIHFTENLKKILEHLNNLRTYEEMMARRNGRQITPGEDKKEDAEEKKDDDNPAAMMKRIKELLRRPFLPAFVTVFDDVWSTEAMNDYGELSLYSLVTSRNSTVTDKHFSNVKKASASASFQCISS